MKISEKAPQISRGKLAEFSQGNSILEVKFKPIMASARCEENTDSRFGEATEKFH